MFLSGQGRLLRKEMFKPTKCERLQFYIFALHTPKLFILLTDSYLNESIRITIGIILLVNVENIQARVFKYPKVRDKNHSNMFLAYIKIFNCSI